MGSPYIRTAGNTKILMVHDRPFIMLAGEVHNSNSSSASYMEHVWRKADELGMNSLLLPVSWEIIEPEEGHFDFTLVDMLIDQKVWKKDRVPLVRVLEERSVLLCAFLGKNRPEPVSACPGRKGEE